MQRETTRSGSASRSFRPEGSMSFTCRSCFVLTEAGLSPAQALLRNANVSERVPAAACPCGGDTGGQTASGDTVDGDGHALMLPHWDQQRRELWLGVHLVKRFRLPSVNQERILAAFEEQGWPPSIDDPLPGDPELNSRTRLHTTLQSLNRRQSQRLLHFGGDGTGQRVLWDHVRTLGSRQGRI